MLSLHNKPIKLPAFRLLKAPQTLPNNRQASQDHQLTFILNNQTAREALKRRQMEREMSFMELTANMIQLQLIIKNLWKG